MDASKNGDPLMLGSMSLNSLKGFLFVPVTIAITHSPSDEHLYCFLILQNPTLPALNCSVENAHPTVSYYARPQVASYNTFLLMTFRYVLREKKEVPVTLALAHPLLFSPYFGSFLIYMR